MSTIKSIIKVLDTWKNCMRCPLGKTAHRKVIYELPPGSHCDILFVGEAPGRSEDAIGRPFIGRSGKFLRETISENLPSHISHGFANLLACRPRDKNDRDRPPIQEEIFMCQERLKLVIRIASPFVIVNLGRIPEKFLPEIARSSGYLGYIYSIYHPSFMIRTGREKSPYYKGWAQQLAEIVRTTEDVKRLSPEGRRQKWLIKGIEITVFPLPPQKQILKAKRKRPEYTR